MSRTTEELLGEALNHFPTMLGYANHDLNDQLVIDAICMRLSAGLEVLNRLDPDVETRSSAKSGRRCGECATGSPTATSWSAHRSSAGHSRPSYRTLLSRSKGR